MVTECSQLFEMWLASSTDKPLIFEKIGDQVQVSRGFPKPRLNKSEAARFLGVSRPTYLRHYDHRLRPGADGLICRKAAQRLLNDLGGRS